MKNQRITGFVIVGAICLSLPLLLLTVCTIAGDGITFESVSAYIGTRRTLSAMKAGDYSRSAKHIDFWGFSEDRTLIDEAFIEEERQRYIKQLETFFDDNMAMREYKILNSVTDDGYTIVTTRVVLATQEDSHSFILRFSKQNGRLCPMGIVVDEADDLTAVVAEAFINIVRTHYPG